uniref:Uncharacterized protein n=1 Tax=Ralstonia syzygii R24 TaxID=907261 RepID=G3A6T4_9RALS|nr:conserved hypothetical protein [Ralstonia syzygii R24]
MGSLNSVVIVHRDGAVIAASPASLQLKSMRSDWGRRLLDTRIPEISKPFRAPTGRLLIFLSHPVIDGQGHLLGYVGGTIYLNEKNLLHTIFVHHYYRDGSYIYVVDRDGTVIYHPNSGYVGDMSRANPAVAEVMTGGAEAQRIKSLHGVDMLAGYAPGPGSLSRFRPSRWTSITSSGSMTGTGTTCPGSSHQKGGRRHAVHV